MKFFSTVLCVALVGVTVPVAGQSSQTTPRKVGLQTLDATPTLQVYESKAGWQIDLSNMGPSHTVVLVLGRDVGPSRLDLGPYGSTMVDVSKDVVTIPIGPADASGDMILFVPRPERLDPSVEGLTATLQAISFDLSAGAPKVTSALTTNVVKIKVTSTARYQ